MPWQCRPGACLLVPSGPGNKSHLFTIVLGPEQWVGYGGNDQVVMVSITTVKPDFPHDTACVIQAGEHPFIEHESYVYYREARIDSAAHVDNMIATMGWHPKEPCSPALRNRIMQGMMISKRVPRHIKLLFTQR